jgi:hypothetical protein
LRWRRWVVRALAFLLAAWAGFLFGWVPWWLAGIATSRRFDYVDRENQGMTPASEGLPFEPIHFEAPDGIRLSGWWVPAPENRGTAILLHGLNRSRIEMLPKLPFLHALGWNALLFDQRRHGESGGEVGTFGAREQQDALVAAGLARQRSGDAPVVLWGVSLGAATAALAAVGDESVAGLVCDSSFRSLRDTVRHHLGLFRRFRWWLGMVPTWPTADLAVYWIGRRGGFDPDSLDVQAAAARMRDRPSLFVCNSGDRRMPQQIAFDLQAAAGERARVLVIPGDSHGGAWREGTAAYGEAVRQLLEEVAPGEPAGAARGDAPTEPGGSMPEQFRAGGV